VLRKANRHAILAFAKLLGHKDSGVRSSAVYLLEALIEPGE
jgi:hypothetical protein